MTVNQRIIKALERFGYPVKPDIYTGKEDRYFTFQYVDNRGADFGDGIPQCNKIDLQVHFFLPIKENYLKIRKEIRDALFMERFTYPSITEFVEPENEIRHLIFECATEEK